MHPRSSPNTNPSSLWLYASDADIAAALGSHRSTVIRSLRRRGFTRTTVEEAFDAAVVTLYRLRPALASCGQPLGRWLRQAAYHRAVDLVRSAGPGELLMPTVPEVPDAGGPDTVVEARLALAAVLARVAAMRPADRNAVLIVLQQELADMGEPDQAAALTAFLADHTTASRESSYMRLSRARARLRRIRGTFTVLPVAAWSRTRLTGTARPLVAGVGVATAVLATQLRVIPPSSPTEGRRTVVQIRSDEGLAPLPGDPSTPKRMTGLYTDLDSTSFVRFGRGRPSGGSGQSSSFQTPPLPVSGSGVRNHPRPPGDKSVLCVRDAGPLTSACLRHPLTTGDSDVFIFKTNG